MWKNSFLLVSICAMAMLLMASRCSDEEDDKAAAPAPTTIDDSNPGLTEADGTLKNPESGVEKDPLGETIGGPDDATAPLDDVPPPPAGEDDGAMLDDPSFEPEPVPDEATDL